MLFSKKKFDNFNFFKVFSNDFVQYSLEGLDWSDAVSQGKHFQQVKLSQIVDSDLGVALIGIALEHRKRYGDYIYSHVGSRILRFNPNIPVDSPTREDYSVSKPFTVDVDLSKQRVIKIE